MSPRPVRPLDRARLLVGVSAVALWTASAPGMAGAANTNPFARVADPAAAVAQAAQAQAAQGAVSASLTAQAQASFARAAYLRSQMDTTQAAARAAQAAAQSSIPNGLGVGGLQAADGATPGTVLWQGADAPTQTTAANGRTEVNIQQTQSQAILNWQTFDVGQQTDLSFSQQSSSWVVLNRITDPNANPTHILGSISAPGTVLIMNANGVIFGGASQVNVGALIAGAAQITDDQFLNNGIYSAQVNGKYAPVFTDAVGAVDVQAGAQLTTNAPASVLQGGGYVMLLGGQVTNEGSITTPLGQTLLAAGDSFLLRPGVSTTANQFSTTRGSEVAPVIAADSANGDVSNTGSIYAQQGDITLAGHTVTQDGVAIATTSVNQRGTIHLLNSATDGTGSVTLTGDSYTAVLPELDSTTTALDSQRAALIAASATENSTRGQGANAQFNDLSTLADREDESRIEIVTGGDVEFQGGSLTQAQGGQVSVSAADRIQVDTGATIDVSGVQNVAMNVADNEILVNIQGNEVRDSPANRDSGTLFNDNVWINAEDLTLLPAGTGGDPNARAYSLGGLIEVSGYLANVGHTIGEWDASAGTITLSAKEVVAQTGSVFDLEGGSLAYQGGVVPETLLEGADGHMYTADDAPADVEMVSVGQSFTDAHSHWGSNYAQTWGNPFTTTTVETNVASYVVGKDGGQLVLSTPTAVFEGTIDAGVITGANQTATRPTGVSDPYALPQKTAPLAGGLSIGEYTANGLAGAYDTDIEIGSGVPAAADGLTLSTAIDPARVGTAWFNADALSGFGLGSLNVVTSGDASVDAPLTLADGGSLRLTAPSIEVNAGITAHGGSIVLGNIETTFSGVSPVIGTDGGVSVHTTVAAGVTLDLSGLWVNEMTDPTTGPDLAFINGGSLTIDSSRDVTLGDKSVVDVSSGGGLLTTGKTMGGAGGSVSLTAGDAFNGAPQGGVLTLDGTINAVGVNGGGTLTLSAPGTLVIGTDAAVSGQLTLGAGVGAPTNLTLDQVLTIAAGQKIPIALQETFNATPTDTPLSSTLSALDPRNNPTGVSQLILQADWVVPTGMSVSTDPFLFANAGQLLPKGTRINFFWSPTIPAGTVIPSDVFPNGIPVTPFQVLLPAGTVATSAVTYAVGTTIPAGAVFNQSVAIDPVTSLDPNLFNSGFKNYVVNAGSGLLVASGTSVDPTMPVYQFSADSFGVRTGADPSTALTEWLPPLFVENPVTATLTQRGGASLTLSALTNNGLAASGGAIDIPQGASVSVDPGQSIKLDAFGQIIVDGDLTAHGGSISLINEAAGADDSSRNFDTSGDPRGLSIWISGDADLDVSGEAYTAKDQFGRAYGLVTDGGSIHIGGTQVFSTISDLTSSTVAFLIIRPGAELNADGAQITVDPSAGRVGPGSGGALTLASNGGSIALDTYSGLYNDGNLHARAGGAGAAGGSFSVILDTPYFSNSGGAIQSNVLTPSILTVVQSATDSGLPDDIAPGTDASSLAFGRATVSADAIEKGGFDTVSLTSRDFMEFSGDVSLSVGQRLILTADDYISGALSTVRPDPTDTPVTGAVKLSAPYVLLTSDTIADFDFASTGAVGNTDFLNTGPTTATFEVDADQIDVQGSVAFSGLIILPNNEGALYGPGFQTVSLISQGDLRFLAPGVAQNSFDSLVTAFDLNLAAARIYPGTNAQAYVAAGYNSAATITISRVGDAAPVAPDSVFGQIIFNAADIEQGGVVMAPLGQISLGSGNGGFHGYGGQISQTLDLLPGSLTSVSAAGLIMPYGGTSDGVNYDYNGAPITPIGIGAFNDSLIDLQSASVDVEKGATLDLSGGGTLTGAAFISGRGGSVNILNTPLVNANPTIPFSSANDQVYAIVPGYASSYAPSGKENGFGAPQIGEQITVPAGVPGLPAGTYTLLPSNYALLPGAYRVELGKAASPLASGVSAIGDGTYVTAGFTGVANTDLKSATPTLLLITPAAGARDLSQFDEESYSAFVTGAAVQFGGAVPVLPIDAGTLEIAFQDPSEPLTGPALTFQGKALMQGATDATTQQVGFGGTAEIIGDGPLEIYGAAPTTDFLGSSIAAADLNAIGAPRLVIGGTIAAGFGQSAGVLTITGSNDIFVRPDVTLAAGEIFLTGQNIDVGQGATLTTIGQAAAPYDSTDGFVYTASGSLLALSNGDLEFVGVTGGSGSINVEAGASLYAGGTLAFATNGPSSIDNTAHFGAKDITLAASTINIGDATDIAAAGGPAGLLFDQSLFDFLISGDPAHGAPGLQALTLSAGGSINLFGDASLDASGTGVDLVLNTPAIYGYGAAGDAASIAAAKITWNGVSGVTPPAVLPGGPGTGQGTLTLQAAEIDFGQFTDLDTNVENRATYGFSTVDLVASSQIVSAGPGSLSVYQAPSTATGAVLGQSGVGGDLVITTPLLTGVQKSQMGYTAGGSIDIAAPAGAMPSTATSSVGGGEIDLTADSVDIDSTILLPSGKLVINAQNDVTLGADSRIDLSGQPSKVQTATVYGFGGDVIIDSVAGAVSQAVGGMIDVSATKANAGTITIGANDGTVSLDGALSGAADAGFTSGDFTVSAGTLSDFAGLNATLTTGGVFDARSFDIKTGDLTIGDGVQAHHVTISLDGGALTVDGTIDASGPAAGTISLAANNGLTLASSAVLDAHGEVLQTDSYGAPIDAENQSEVELNAAHGMLTLASGATIDVSSPDGVARGVINLDAQRTSETSGDIDINASGPLTITGAQSIAVNAFWTYSPTDPYGTIVQDNGDLAGDPVSSSTGFLGMNQVDVRSGEFIDAALANTALMGRLAGLTAYQDAFHLRPGVEIDSSTPNGTLTVAGDIDLAGFRYASLNPNFQQTAAYGSGEPGALVIRAGGNLDVVGSISDGFEPAPATDDDNGWFIQAGLQTSSTEALVPVALNAGTSFPATNVSLRYDIPINATALKANAAIPTQVTLSSAFTVPAGTTLTAPVYDSGGALLYPTGTVFAASTVLPAGTQLAAGSVMPGTVSITAMTWPAGATLGDFTFGVSLSTNITVPFEGVIPVGTTVQMSTPTELTRAPGQDGSEGSILAIAAMLPQGDLSWSMTLVAGADLAAADPHVVKPVSLLKSLGVSGNITLLDTHVSETPAFSKQVKKYVYYYYGRPYYVSSPSGFGCTHYGNTACGVKYVTQYFPAQISGADPSVIRTGTGDLDLIAGGSFSEQSLYGVYTAGTPSAPIPTSDGSDPYNEPLGQFDGAPTPDPVKAAADEAAYQAWYPEHGGNVLVSAQGDIGGYIATSNNNTRFVDSDLTSNWLFRQGGGGLGTAPTAWWVNFGIFAQTQEFTSDNSFIGFQGIGTLGGGNLVVVAGGNAGVGVGTNSGLDLAVASTGRVLADGTLVQTGGGDLTLKVGGTLNAFDPISARSDTADFFGSVSDLRGDIDISAGAVGEIVQNIFSSNFTSLDPRTQPFGVFKLSMQTPGPVVTPGDGTVSIQTRGDLVLGGAGDAGNEFPLALGGMPYTLTNADGSVTSAPGGSGTTFTLWTPTTAIDLYSAGGDVTPQGAAIGSGNVNDLSGFYPGTLIVAAANGDIRLGAAFELAPAPAGQLELLANGSIYGADTTISMSGAAMSSLATPFHPAFSGNFEGGGSSNADPGSPYSGGGYLVGAENPIAFGPDSPTGDLHAGDNQPALIYAGVDIDDVAFGLVVNQNVSFGFSPNPTTWYIAAKPFNIVAGRDIVGLGTTPDVFVNNGQSDISLIQAGRDIIYQSATVAGPGLLDIQAGRNLYEGFYGQLVSVGPLYGIDPTNPSTGAGIVTMAGVGPNGPDYTDFAKLYFSATNQLPGDGTRLAGSGEVVHSYDKELLTWLQQRFGYTGDGSGALAYFLALPNDQQGVFVRQVYYEELNAGGIEFNDPNSSRFKSYLRGREAIATLFPTTDAQGQPITYTGDITMFSGLGKTGLGQTITLDSGIRTAFGGDIQILDPGGQTIIGVEGVTPGANAGLITQGTGDIDIYSEGSILLGESRILTTFGGDILAWSATGDINAGRGSKTTVLFTPPRRVYTDYGQVILAPSVPSTGAGIGTLNPIPSVPAGDINLIAPLGTVDAGEAGIRVSGNLNIAALFVLNAANIQVQGTATGLPQAVAVNVGALTAASNASAAVTQIAQQIAQRQPPPPPPVPMVLTVRFLGFGDE